MEKEIITVEELQESIENNTSYFCNIKIKLTQQENIIEHNSASLTFDNCEFFVDPTNSIKDDSIKSLNSSFYLNINKEISLDNCKVLDGIGLLNFHSQNKSAKLHIKNCPSIKAKSVQITDINSIFLNESTFYNTSINIESKELLIDTIHIDSCNKIDCITIENLSILNQLKFSNTEISLLSITSNRTTKCHIPHLSFFNFDTNSLFLQNINIDSIKTFHQPKHISSSKSINFSTLNIRNSIINEINIERTNNFSELNLSIIESEIEKLSCTANLINTRINNTLFSFIAFNDAKVKPSNLSGINYKTFNISNTCTIELEDKNDIDTINTLREIFKNNNYHEYLQYNALSQNYLLEDKEGKLKCRDKILLWLNKHSNEFGTNWAKGVLFTVVTGCIFYCIALITHPFVFCFIDKPLPAVNCSQLNRVGMGFIEYITSADLFYSNENSINNTLKQSNFLTLLFYTLGKLSVMYGIYQTIQAFRKYRN